MTADTFPASGGKAAYAVGRQETNFDLGWRFHLGDPADAHIPGYKDHHWHLLNLPHDWAINCAPDPRNSESNGFFPGGIGWYRKSFSLENGNGAQKVFLLFDGVYHRSDVYLNGYLLGHRPYGYVPFYYDLTPHMAATGENVLAVRVDCSDGATSRWYSGAGVYRHVRLVTTSMLHIPIWGVGVTTPIVTPEKATILVKTRVRNDASTGCLCRLKTIFVSEAGAETSNETAEYKNETADYKVDAGEEREFIQELEMSRPALWSPQHPHLYTARTIVNKGGTVVDAVETTFGVREARFDPDSGFVLNGVPLKIQGVCVHHDGGCVGTAVPEKIWARRLWALKDLGCNAIRVGHCPPATEFLDFCDRLGLLVIDEALDKWKAEYPYGRYFDDWWRRDLDAMLERDRNHPSVILWGVGNEVREQGMPEGTRLLQELVAYVHEQEPTRPVVCATYPDRSAGRSINDTGFADAMDVVSLNYEEHWFELDRQKHPKRIMLSSEAYPYFRGRADYGTERPLYNPFCDFAAVNPWLDVRDRDYVAGMFVWAGIDYLGESAGWPSKGWPNGLLDTCGWPKAVSGLHRALWSDSPTVRLAVQDDAILSDPGHAAWGCPPLARHWNGGTAGRVMRVMTFTNCEAVELLLNGKSLGVRSARPTLNSTIEWYVPFQSGVLTALGLNEGVQTATDELRTAGEASRLLLRPDCPEVVSDGRDIGHIEIILTDDAGVTAAFADRRVDLTASGPGELIGIDNGDLRDHTPYRAAFRRTLQGRCLALVRPLRGAEGRLTLTARAENLPAASVVINVVSPKTAA